MDFSKLYKIKEGKLSTLKEWFEILDGDRRGEAVATFKHENVSREVFVLFKGGNGQNYVVGLNEVTGERSNGNMAVKINQEHKKILNECLEPISENGEILLDLNL